MRPNIFASGLCVAVLMGGGFLVTRAAKAEDAVPATTQAVKPVVESGTNVAAGGNVATTKPVYGQVVTTDVQPGRMVSYASADRDIRAYLVQPTGSEATPAVILVHDIFGMSDWVKEQAQKIARQGYTVLVPNLYSRIETGNMGIDAKQAWVDYEKTSDQQVMQDLSAAVEYLQGEGTRTADKSVGVVGYDMGGIYAMMLAAKDLRVKAAVNFYGRVLYSTTGPTRPISPVESLFNLHAPLLSFYGAVDPQVPASQVRALETRLASNPNAVYYQVITYPGVGHGFVMPLREGYNEEAMKDSEIKTKTFLAKFLRGAPPKTDE